MAWPSIRRLDFWRTWITWISMTNLNPIKKKLSKADRKIYRQDPSKLLAEFFNGVVIELDEEYKYDS